MVYVLWRLLAYKEDEKQHPADDKATSDAENMLRTTAHTLCSEAFSVYERTFGPEAARNRVLAQVESRPGFMLCFRELLLLWYASKCGRGRVVHPSG